MAAKGADGKEIKVGDIAAYNLGERDEKLILVDYASEGTVSGTCLQRTENYWSLSGYPFKFTAIPLTPLQKEEVLRKAILDDIPPK